MKSSNLALRLEDEEALPEGAITEADQTTPDGNAEEPAGRRPRRSLEFRSIAISDQGFAPFRVR